jgi:virginiamycin A acetyltransferase
MWSVTLRQILRDDFQVEVGRYTYGRCLMPGHLPPRTRLGHFCSLADGLQVLRRNHPSDRITQHPLFYNSKLGLLQEDSIGAIADNPLTIGNDVWIGQNVLIAPGCRRVGDSAIIASGAVVTTDVPPFAIVAGVPARVIRSRVSDELQAILRGTAWWEKTLPELVEFLPFFLTTLSPELALEFSAAFEGRFGHLHKPVGRDARAH